MKTDKRAKWMLGLSMIIFGTLGPFTRNIAVTSGELALYRALLATLLIVIFFFVTGQKVDFKAMKRELILLFFSGMAIGINWILLFEAYRYTTISTATLSYYFAPVLVTIVCPFLFRERLTKKQVLCFVMSTVGLALIIGFEGDMGGKNHLLGISLGLGAAIFYASVILMNKYIKNVEGIQRTFFQFIAAIIVLIPYVLCTGGIHPEVLDGKGWICLFVVGLVHTGITYCMYFTSLKELKGQEVAILSYLDPLVAVIVSVVILGEKMNFMQLIGGIFILGFTFLNEYAENVDK